MAEIQETSQTHLYRISVRHGSSTMSEGVMQGKHSLTKHHRKMRCRGGDDSNDNISMVEEQHHRAFHLLFGNGTPEQIAKKLNDIWLPKDCPVFVKRQFGWLDHTRTDTDRDSG